MQLTRNLFHVAYMVLVAERALELALSYANQRHALARGGLLAKEDPFRRIVIFHSLFLAAALTEVHLMPSWSSPFLAWSMALAILLCLLLRCWSMFTLGRAWNIRVLCIPGMRTIQTGPYRFIRHPIYVAVTIEVFALPLIAGAWRSALVFGLLNLMLIRRRIQVEEATLRRYSDYANSFSRRPRFLPGARARRRR